MYELVFTKRGLEDLNKLEEEIKNRIFEKLQLCKENPFHFVERLTEIPGFKLRIGDYRVIVDIDRNLQKIFILKAGHRKNIYEN